MQRHFLTIVLVLMSMMLARAQPTAPAAVNGCIYLSGTVTLSDKQSNVFICDVNGRLLVH